MILEIYIWFIKIVHKHTYIPHKFDQFFFFINLSRYWRMRKVALLGFGPIEVIVWAESSIHAQKHSRELLFSLLLLIILVLHELTHSEYTPT